MPVPSGEDVQVPMFGFAMTQFRLVHDITANEYEELGVPVYAPSTGSVTVVADDARIDNAAPPRGTP
jgi:hypothetical protein